MSTLLRVLMVEDSPDDGALITRELRRGGYEPVSERVETAEEMHAALDQATWDLVLSDYTMPRFSALHALEVLQTQNIDIPFIIVSGTIGEETAVDAMKAGAQDFIDKGKLTRLVPALQRELREAQIRRQRRLGEAENARLALVVNSSDDAIFSISGDGALTTWNPGAERMYGYTAAEILGRNFSMLLPEERRGDLLSARERLDRGETLVHYQQDNQRKDGTRISVSLKLSPILDAAGAVVGVSAIARDVTEYRRLEGQFRQAQKMEAVGRLAGGVAHDFNNLLTVINGYSAMLLGNLDSADPARECLEEIKKAGTEAAALTRELLAFSRQQVLDSRTLDLNAIVSDSEKMLRRLIGEDIDLAIMPAAGLAKTKADAAQIKQIIVNLAVNARDAMPHGGKLTIETSNVELDSGYMQKDPTFVPGRYVMLAVSDTGIGMDAETQTHIFEPFFTTKEEGKGTGLGLAMVYGTVKQSGGFIRVYSELGQGATFKIYLPQFEGVEPAHPPAELEQHLARGTETVLLLEDDKAVREFTAKALRSLGYSVLDATSAQEALQIGKQYQGHIDVLVTDIILPAMSGRIVAQQLTRLRPKLSVLYTSGYTDGAITRHALLHEGAVFLQKPFTPADLSRKIREALNTNAEGIEESRGQQA